MIVAFGFRFTPPLLLLSLLSLLLLRLDIRAAHNTHHAHIHLSGVIRQINLVMVQDSIESHYCSRLQVIKYIHRDQCIHVCPICNRLLMRLFTLVSRFYANELDSNRQLLHLLLLLLGLLRLRVCHACIH